MCIPSKFFLNVTWSINVFFLAPTSEIDMDFKTNAKGVETESLHSSTAGSSKRPSSEGVYFGLNLHCHKESPKTLSYMNIVLMINETHFICSRIKNQKHVK